MRTYTEEDLAVLYLLKKFNSSRSNAIAFVKYNVEIMKMLNFDKIKADKALDIAYDEGFIDVEQMGYIKPTAKGEEVIYTNNTQGEIISMDLKEKKIARYQYLSELYSTVNGSKNHLVNAIELGEKLEFDRATSLDIATYLNDEGLIEFAGLGGIIRITHPGIIEIEGALSHPDEETKYFPPVNFVQNTVNIHGNNSAPIQVGNENSTQTTTKNNNSIENIRKWILELEEILHKEQLKNEELNDEIETVKSLLNTKNPKMSFLQSSLETIKGILVTAVSNAAVQALIASIPS